LLQSVGTGAVLVEVVVDSNLVSRTHQRQDQRITRAGDLDVARRNIPRELDRIDLAGAGVVVVDGVLAPATAEAVDVAARIAAQGVVTDTTVENVVAIAAVQLVVALTAQQQVIAIFTVQTVITLLAVQHIVARTTVQVIVAGSGIDHVGRGIGPQVVVAGCTQQRQFPDLVDAPGSAVGETNLLQSVGTGAVLVEVVVDSNLVSRTHQR